MMGNNPLVQAQINIVKQKSISVEKEREPLPDIGHLRKKSSYMF